MGASSSEPLRPDDLLVGESPAIRKTRELVRRLGPTGLSVLIQGPTGVGKEVVAQALHRASGRTGALVSVNVCAIPDAMFESALFGHVRGAFTGAVADHPGYVTEAHQGTLFLDEIGDLGLPLQAKLLRVLETRIYRKVGGRHDERSDFRLVVATNSDLRRAVAEGRFRADLAYRFGAAVIDIPALCQRTEDIPLLAAHFVRQNAAADRTIMPGAVRLLEQHAWPGNVRELRHTIELACALAGHGTITDDHVNGALARVSHGTGTTNHPAHAAEPNVPRRELLEILERCGWHVPSVALSLGVTRKTIYARIQRLGIEIPARYHRREPPIAEGRELRLL